MSDVDFHPQCQTSALALPGLVFVARRETLPRWRTTRQSIPPPLNLGTLNEMTGSHTRKHLKSSTNFEVVQRVDGSLQQRSVKRGPPRVVGTDVHRDHLASRHGKNNSDPIRNGMPPRVQNGTPSQVRVTSKPIPLPHRSQRTQGVVAQLATLISQITQQLAPCPTGPLINGRIQHVRNQRQRTGSNKRGTRDRISGIMPKARPHNSIRNLPNGPYGFSPQRSTATSKRTSRLNLALADVHRTSSKIGIDGIARNTSEPCQLSNIASPSPPGLSNKISPIGRQPFTPISPPDERGQCRDTRRFSVGIHDSSVCRLTRHVE